MKKKQALLVLAPGFEEIEAISVVDVLRRAGVVVTLAGLDRQEWVEGGHGVRLGVDGCLACSDVEQMDLLVLPGGMPGTRNLGSSSVVKEVIVQAARENLVLGAICAAPVVLAAAGLLEGRRVTCYPGFEQELKGAVYTASRVEQDGRIITASGPGSAIEFALALLVELGLSEKAGQLRSDMLV